jgi:hypothetical protein
MSDVTPAALPPRVKNLVGSSFGRLTGTAYAGKGPHSYHYWECQCSCGVSLKKLNRDLGNGDAKSCGCLRRETTSALGKSAVTHGRKGTPEYRVWSDIKTRVSNQSDPHWANYGGRGIIMCKDWMDSFEAFYAYVGDRPGDHYSIDRIDNNGNYEPGNVRWATYTQQQRNRRSNRILTCDGETMPMSAWTERMGFTKEAIGQRLLRGWSVQDAIKTPVP